MKCMLTTDDNPFDPFEQFDEWYIFDEAKGYCTSGYVARIVRTANDLSKEDQENAIEAAIDEIVAMHPLGHYKKVVLEK